MNPKILMIEDDASICDMTKMNLNMNGFQQVYCASDGREGLALAAKLLPDLILLDVMLPGIDGLTVCRNLKNNPARADIPIIMLTSGNGGGRLHHETLQQQGACRQNRSSAP